MTVTFGVVTTTPESDGGLGMWEWSVDWGWDYPVPVAGDRLSLALDHRDGTTRHHKLVVAYREFIFEADGAVGDLYVELQFAPDDDAELVIEEVAEVT